MIHPVRPDGGNELIDGLWIAEFTFHEVDARIQVAHLIETAPDPTRPINLDIVARGQRIR
jgi:hypothetical protein